MAGIDSRLLERLNSLPTDRLAGIRRGVEKESLRVLPDGSLAPTPHPAALGSALTHPCITTDFSESQVELITELPPPRIPADLPVRRLAGRGRELCRRPATR